MMIIISIIQLDVLLRNKEIYILEQIYKVRMEDKFNQEVLAEKYYPQKSSAFNLFEFLH